MCVGSWHKRTPMEVTGTCVCSCQPKFRVTGVQTYLSPDYLGKDYLHTALFGAGH